MLRNLNMAAAKTERNVGFARKQLEKHGWCEGEY